MLYSGLLFFCSGSLSFLDFSLSLFSGSFLCSSGSSLSGSLLSLSGSSNSSLFLGSSLQLSSILGNDLYRNLDGNLLVVVNQSYIVTNLLSILHGDDLAINLLTELLQFLSNLISTYRTVELTGSANLSGNLQSYTLQLSSL